MKVVPSSDDLHLAEQVIDRSGLAAYLEARLPTGGRPRQLPAGTLLVGLLLLARSGQPLHLKRVHLMLAELPEADRRWLGVQRPSGVLTTERQVGRLFRNIAACLDGSAHFAGAKATPAVRAERDTALQLVCDRLLEATMPSELNSVHGGSYAIDATIVEAWARPPRGAVKPTANARRLAHPRGPAANLGELDPAEQAAADAAQPRRRRRPARPGTDATGRGWKRLSHDPDASLLGSTGGKGPRHSYALHLAVLVGQDGADTDVPCLARRMVITPSTANPAPAATGLFARLAADMAALRAGTALAELPAGGVQEAGTELSDDERAELAGRLRGHLSDVIADRGCTFKDADTFTLPLRALGANVVLELHPLEAGRRGTHQGALILDGALHCPGTPEPLQTIPEPKFDATAGDRAAYQARIAKREPFSLRRLGRPDEHGRQRLQCPAAAGRVVCPLFQASTAGSGRKPEVLDPPAQADEHGELQPLPTCCAQQTITVTADELPLAQKDYYGSLEHYRSSNRRDRVEGFNGNLKQEACADLRRGRGRVMGRAKFALLSALAVAATNLRLTERWHERRQRAGNAPAVAPRRRRAAKTIASLSAHTPTGAVQVRGP